MSSISHADYLAMRGRLDRRPRAEIGGQTYEHNLRERNLHEGILAACRLRGWIVFHGSMAHRTFRTEGEPDFVILGDGGRTLLIEAKSGPGKLTLVQMGIQIWAQKLGHTVHVVRSMREFYKVIS